MVTIVPAASIFNQVIIPETHNNQLQFEEYVLTTLFPQPAYEREIFTSSFKQRMKQWQQHALEPQLFLRDTETGNHFMVECKYRSGCIANSFQLAQSLTLEHKKTEIDTPYFFILGIGGTSDNPAQIFLINLHQSEYLVLYKRHLKGKDISAGTQILSNILWKK